MKVKFGVIVLIVFLLCTSFSSLGIGGVADEDLPESFCWCDVQGVDYTPAMKNQAPAPTCEAYALCDALETKIHYEYGQNFGCDLSEAHLFFYSGGTTDWGVNVQEPANYLMEYGVPDEGSFPDPHRPYDSPFESVEGWQNRTVKISEWGWVECEEQAIKEALIEHGPLVICMLVRADFNRYSGGIYTPNAGVPVGGHVITIVGYDDAQACWIIRNTWGDSWGEDGYIRVAYDAHSESRPFFRNFYGGTGILYVEGIYGNIAPDVPKILIKTPDFYKSYIGGLELPILFRNLALFQAGAPRIIGGLSLELSVEDAERVSLYWDGQFVEEDIQYPFEFDVPRDRGLHCLEVYAFDADGDISKDIIDLHVLL